MFILLKKFNNKFMVCDSVKAGSQYAASACVTYVAERAEPAELRKE